MNPIEVIDLRKHFYSNMLRIKKEILKGVNLKVPQGSIFGFLGPNGAGKTTTIKCLLGLIKINEGSCKIFGVDCNKSDSRTSVGFLPENPHFYEYLNIKELLRFTGKIKGKKISRDEIKNLINLTGLKGKENLKLKKYSKGMTQRAGFAQALVNDPQLLILDEPFSGLDPIGRKEFRDIILRLKDEGKTIFFSSHILQDVQVICDNVAILLNGQIKLTGTLDEILKRSTSSIEIIYKLENLSLLEDKNIAYKEYPNFLLSSFENEEEMNDNLKELINLGAKIVSINEHKNSLEDIFVQELEDEN